MTIDQELRAAADELLEVIGHSPVPPMRESLQRSDDLMFDHLQQPDSSTARTVRKRMLGVAAAVAATIVVVGVAVVVDRSRGDFETDPASSPGLADSPQLSPAPAGGDASDNRLVVSPLVMMSTALVHQAESEMFSVAVDNSGGDRSYWRLMALTEFDGNIWRRPSNFDDLRVPVDGDAAADVSHRTVRQTITTKRLVDIYLPAAYEITDVIDSNGIGIEYEAATSALVVRDEDRARAEDGFTYIIDSAVPDLDSATIPVPATDALDRDFLEEHTQLPAGCTTEQSPAKPCWPTRVTTLAQEITAGAETDLQRAQQLQEYFLDPTNFTYDLDVAAGHDNNTIEDFLFSERRGYSEQFAGAFAAMARSIGLPTRVAVGFIWGDWDRSRQEFIVRGEHAHAWPEVYFAGAGWIFFDPTPGHNPPHDSDITGDAPAQVNEGDQS